jgi:hypothetical protein
MTTPLNPNIGSSGLWTLASPFDAKLQAGVSYSCVAVRLLSDIIGNGGDPFTLYYSPNGLTQTDFQNDVSAGASIVSLQATGGTWLYLPNTYITQMPSQNNVPYTSIVLGVHCGALPDLLDLTYVKSKVSLAVQDAIGVTPTIKSLAVSAKTLISQTEHAAITSTRNAAISQAGTPTAQLITVKGQLTSCQQQVTSLTSYISSLVSAGLIDENGNIVSGGGGGVTNTLDPQSLPDGLVLVDDNLSVAAPLGFGAARSIIAHNSGLYYVEATVVNLNTAAGVGLVNGREDLTGVGSDANGIMAFCGLDSGNGVFTNNAFLAGTSQQFTLSAGDIVGMAINLDAKLIWFYHPMTRLWNASASANPVGNVGGIDISGILSGGYNGYVYPCAMVEMTGDGGVVETADTVTVNLGDQPFINVVPAGYSVWGHSTSSGGSGGDNGGGTVTNPTVNATFDSAVLPSGMVLQNASMTVVGTKNEWQTARTTYGQSSGLLYAEATINRLTGAVGFGICNQLEAPSGELGADANGIMMYTNMSKVTSGVFYLGATVNAIGSQAPMQGSTVGIAVNLSRKLIWFYNPITQQWNGGTPTEQNPDGNIGGISIASICTEGGLPAQVFPAVSTWQVSDSVTYNPGSNTFVNPVPAGYSAWNTEVVSS